MQGPLMHPILYPHFYTFNPHHNPLSGVISLYFPTKKAGFQSGLANYSRSRLDPSLYTLAVIILRINFHCMENGSEFPLHYGWEHKHLTWSWCDLWWPRGYDLTDRIQALTLQNLWLWRFHYITNCTRLSTWKSVWDGPGLLCEGMWTWVPLLPTVTKTL